jgi:hypothetical protein
MSVSAAGFSPGSIANKRERLRDDWEWIIKSLTPLLLPFLFTLLAIYNVALFTVFQFVLAGLRFGVFVHFLFTKKLVFNDKLNPFRERRISF